MIDLSCVRQHKESHLYNPKSWYVQKNVGSDLELKLFCSIIEVTKVLSALFIKNKNERL